MTLPSRPRTHVLEARSEAFLLTLAPVEWIVRDVSHDYGLDKNIEIVDSGAVTGKNFSIQLKATDRSFASGDSPTVSIATSTLEYMANRPEPVMIILYSDPDADGYWIWRHELSISNPSDQHTMTIHFNAEQTLSTIDWQVIRSEVLSFLTRPTVDSVTVSRLERFGRYSIDLSKAGILLKEEVDHLEALINDPEGREVDFQRMFEVHPQILLGGEYTRIHAQLRLDKRGPTLIPDFFIQSVTGLCDILELKRPSQRIVVRRPNRSRFAVSVHEGLAQVRNYSEFFEDESNRSWFESEFGLKVFRPLKILVIGRDSEFQDPIERRLIETSIGDSRIFTYDDVLRMARAKQVE